MPTLPLADVAIRSLLESADGFASFAPGGVHIYQPPQDERRPRVVVNQIGGERPRRFRAAQSDTSLAGYEVPVMEIACLAPSPQQARRLALYAQQILEAIEPTDVTVDGASIRVHWVETDPERSLVPDDQEGAGPTCGYGFTARVMVSQPGDD